MGSSSFVYTDFRGGFWSEEAQGRMDDPDYKRAMNECYNGYPIAAGSWVRRPAFRQIGYTRFGAPAKLVSLASVTKNHYNMEMSAGHLRFIHGPQFVTDATQQLVTDVSTDNPAVVTTDGEHGWSTGDQVMFSVQDGDTFLALAPMTSRVFAVEGIDATHFALHDLLTDNGFDGSTVTWSDTSLMHVSRLTDVATPYLGDTWRAVNRIQTDKQVLMLHPAFWPRSLEYQEASDSTWVNVELSPASFIDGPYLDPVDGSIATPNGLTGIISLAFGFADYDAARAYQEGDYVTYSSGHWISLQGLNINNTPADASLYWARTSALDFMTKKTFSETDIGRHIRLLSEPPLWSSGTTYADGDVVTLNNAYWMCIVDGTVGVGSNQPGGGVDHWVPYAQGARWTWGKVVDLGAGTPITGTHFGNMTQGGGLAAIFNGAKDTQDTVCGKNIGTSGYAGVHVGSPTAVTGGRVWPGRNASIAGGSGSPGGLGGGAGVFGGGGLIPGVNLFSPVTGTVVNPNQSPSSIGGSAGGYTFAVGETASVTVNLRGKATSPGNASDGTLLGTSGAIPYTSITSAPIHVSSSNNTTTYSYVWFEIIIAPTGHPVGVTTTVCAAEAEFYSSGLTGNGISVQLLGDPLLYDADIRVWRLGRYTATDPVYPVCGCFHEGRVWLAADKNHFDASKSGANKAADYLNFAPTEPDGTVTDASAISYTFNSEVNAPIQWMLPGEGGIVLGLAGGERLIFSTNLNAAITPTNANVELKTSYTSAPIDPATTPLTSIFVHSNGRDVHEYMRDAYSGRFVSPPLTEHAKSLTESGIVQVAYQRALTSIIWACTADGRLVGSTYERSYLPFRSESPPDYNAWHHHEHGANRSFMSVSVGPSTTAKVDALAVVTQDNETGVGRIEVASDLMPTSNDIFDCNFLDGMFVPAYGNTYDAVPSNPDVIPPTPPTPPGEYRWVVEGYTLTGICPANAYLPPYNPLDIPADVLALPNPPATAEPALEASGNRLVCFMSAPTSLGISGCDTQGFTAGSDIPGIDVFLPSPGQPFSVLICMGAVFGDLGWRGYQHWEPNTPTSVPSAPVWTNV